MEHTKQVKLLKNILLLFITTFCVTTYGQNIVGKWETFDDKTHEKKGVVEIYKKENIYFGRIVETFIGPKNATCLNCHGDNKEKPMIGLVVIENMSKDGDEYDGGTILDPESGKIYKASLELIAPDKLKVRGYIGLPLFGRTQYWRRTE